ncbi:phospholipase [Pseudoneobacillus sp. C159]
MSRNKRHSGCIFPNYRYCGPGCSGPGAPLNDIDACCKKHDRCLGRKESECCCDRELLKCLRSKMHRDHPRGRDAALMYGAMKVKTVFSCWWN